MNFKLPRVSDLQPRERLLAAGCAVVLFVVALDRLVLGPWGRHAQAIQHEIREMEQALQSHQRLLARKDRVLAELGRYQQYLTPAIADDLQMAALLKEVEELAGQSQVHLNEVKPLTVETSGPAKHYSLEVRFECTLEEWVDFVFRLQSSPSLYEVARASLSAQEETPDRLVASLRLVSASLQAGT